MKNKITLGDLVVNIRWPHYGTCLVIDMKDEKVFVLHQEGEYAQKKGYSWDYNKNWVKIRSDNKSKNKQINL